MDPRIFLNECLKEMTERGASDLHIKSDAVPRVRIAGRIVKTNKDDVAAATVHQIAEMLMNKYQRESFEKSRGADLAFQSEHYGRFRVNIFQQRGTISIVIRTIYSAIPSFKELMIPDAFEKIAMKERGLVLVSGSTSSGKSTTVASMVNYMNQVRDAHIVTVEDPIEYLHEDKRCVVNQREIGVDAESFSDALKYVVRQDPDIIVIGEMRDPESFRSAIAASETGHLVISTVHAKNVAQVFDRIVGFFPSEQKELVLNQLSFNFVAISCQRLLPKKDGGGLVPAFELVMQNPTTMKLVREGKIDKLQQAMLNCVDEGMVTFNQSLVKLYKDGLISREEALISSDNPSALEMNMQGIFLDDSGGGIIDR